MSARAAAKPQKQIPGLVLGGEPRVDLLPPEVHQRVKAAATRRLLAVFVVVAVLVAAGGYALATLRSIGAQSALAESQARTITLLNEQAQYSEASGLAAQLAVGAQVTTMGTSTEVMWSETLDAIAAAMAPSTFVSWQASGRAPWEYDLTPIGPLRQPRVATLIVTIDSATAPDGAALYRKLEDIEGFADASIDLIELKEAVYRTTLTINLGPEALSGRGVVETEETEEGEATEEASADQPSQENEGAAP